MEVRVIAGREQSGLQVSVAAAGGIDGSGGIGESTGATQSGDELLRGSLVRDAIHWMGAKQ
ncbi:hypothetical protein VFPBJ_11769 [Purpureocillium lilacinum]|uniref:Uncharacterized protein n=1 Tax=Purpureocillium lilacinum TaxID=33203 RepID=A0A179EW87_PURLI|nr:hypothetical protein VFPBJ_11769 [Purpureocillium lilacinum]